MPSQRTQYTDAYDEYKLHRSKEKDFNANGPAVWIKDHVEAETSSQKHKVLAKVAAIRI